MKSLATGLRIIAMFQHGGRDRTVGEIARALAIPKSQVSRMLAEFRDAGWLTQDPKTRAYSIGLRAYVVGVRYLGADRLTREALPALRTAADKSGFTTSLSILDGVEPLYLFGVEAPVYADLGTRMGEHFPMHASSPGKALAAFSPPEVFERWAAIHGLDSVTSRTICDGAALKREFAVIRERGYAVSRGERIPGFGGVAAPVFAGDGSLAAVIGLAFPESHVLADQIDDYAAILHDSAQRVSERLGSGRYPFGRDAPKYVRSPRRKAPEKARAAGATP